MPRGDWDVASPSLTLPPGAGPGDSRLFLGPDVPLILQTFYSVYGTSYACILAYSDATNYEFTLWLKTATGGMSAMAKGWVLGGITVVEHTFTYFPPPGTGLPFNTLIGPVLSIPAAGYQYNFRGVAGASLDPTDAAYSSVNIGDEIDFCIDSQFGAGIAAPRGLRVGEYTATAGGLAGSAGAEVAIPSANWVSEPSITWKRERLYRVLINMQHYATVADVFTTFRLRKGSASTTGTIFGTWVLRTLNLANNVWTVYLCAYIKNTSGADVNSQLSLTVQRSTGAGTNAIYGDAATFPLIMVAEDIGRESDHNSLAAVINSM